MDSFNVYISVGKGFLTSSAFVYCVQGSDEGRCLRLIDSRRREIGWAGVDGMEGDDSLIIEAYVQHRVR